MTVTEKDRELAESLIAQAYNDIELDIQGFYVKFLWFKIPVIVDFKNFRTNSLNFWVYKYVEWVRDHREQSTAALEKRLQESEKAREVLVEALERLQNCDWVITPMDRMDAVREIARQALATHNKAMGE